MVTVREEPKFAGDQHRIQLAFLGYISVRIASHNLNELNIFFLSQSFPIIKFHDEIGILIEEREW